MYHMFIYCFCIYHTWYRYWCVKPSFGPGSKPWLPRWVPVGYLPPQQCRTDMFNRNNAERTCSSVIFQRFIQDQWDGCVEPSKIFGSIHFGVLFEMGFPIKLLPFVSQCNSTSCATSSALCLGQFFRNDRSLHSRHNLRSRLPFEDLV